MGSIGPFQHGLLFAQKGPCFEIAGYIGTNYNDASRAMILISFEVIPFNLKVFRSKLCQIRAVLQ